MRDLLSKKSHRQLELLELLFEHKRWFHRSELAELLIVQNVQSKMIYPMLNLLFLT